MSASGSVSAIRSTHGIALRRSGIAVPWGRAGGGSCGLGAREGHVIPDSRASAGDVSAPRWTLICFAAASLSGGNLWKDSCKLAEAG